MSFYITSQSLVSHFYHVLKTNQSYLCCIRLPSRTYLKNTVSTSPDLSSRSFLIAILNLFIEGRYFTRRGIEFQRRVPCDIKEFKPTSVREGGTSSSLESVRADVLPLFFLKRAARYTGCPMFINLYNNTAAKYSLLPLKSSH